MNMLTGIAFNALAIVSLICCCSQYAFCQSAQKAIFTDDFSVDGGTWETRRGQWRFEGGKLHATEPQNVVTTAFSSRAPFISSGRVEATMIADKRECPEGYILCGIMLAIDPSNYWTFCLVEGPTGGRWVEMGETVQDERRAHDKGATKLPMVLDNPPCCGWGYGIEYRAALELDKDGVTASFTDVASGKLLFKRRYEFGNATAVRSGTIGFYNRGMSVTFDDAAVYTDEATVTADHHDSTPRVALHRAEENAPDISAALKDLGMDMAVLSADDLSTEGKLNPRDFPVFIILNARRFASAGIPTLRRYLREGGKVVFVGGPAFGTDIAGFREPPPTIETVSPPQKVYGVHNITGMQPIEPILDSGLGSSTPIEAVCPIHRHTGAGYGSRSNVRWIPLLNALTKDHRSPGVAAWMLINLSFPYAGSAVCSFGFDDEEVLKSYEFACILAAVCGTMRNGLFFANAGSEFFSYYPDEPVKFGAKVVNLGTENRTVRVRMNLFRKGETEAIWKNEKELASEPGKTGVVEFEWRPDKPLSGVYRVRTELMLDNDFIDVIEHEMGVLRDRNVKPDPAEFVRVEGHDFVLNGAKWNPVGVNYWPLYSGAQEPDDYSRGWLTPPFYQPDDIEADLCRMDDLGINMVCIQMETEGSTRNMLDFLRRCGRHGIRVFGHMQSTSPLTFDAKRVSEFITSAGLASIPELFAYDIIWEPGNWVFNKDNRPRWSADWEKWIVERYGSIENAEKDWKFKLERENGKLCSPTDDQMSKDGEWRVMTAAYRRFMDDLMSGKWRRAVRVIKELDPNHLVSFRQGNTLPQDFALTATAKHVDFMCPEGYCISNDEDGHNAAGFITKYADFTTRGKPVIWMEFGQCVLDSDKVSVSSRKLKTQAAYHELFYRVALETGANGTAPWWWPGGLRIDEASDFGMINMDGSPRPSAQLLRKYAPLLKADRPLAKPDTWITVDRDAHPGGYWHITFKNGRNAYRKAVSKGQFLGIRTAGTGTDSANTPLLAVGNTQYDGTNPPKFLNAEFNRVAVLNAAGQWVEVTADGQVIEVVAGKPVMAEASVGNTGEAEWLSPAKHSGAGGVCLSAREGDVRFSQPIPMDTPYLTDAKIAEFELSAQIDMTATNCAWFGEKLEFILKPAK
jgi:hypothetical protein